MRPRSLGVRSLDRGAMEGEGAFRVTRDGNGYIRRMICKKCLVSGRVQGVFYRGAAAQRARELGVRGYARNLPDGRVEVLACGEEEAVQTFVSWLWIGSSAAKVSAVEAVDAPELGERAPADFHAA
jgi:acylphosphatase